MNTYNHDNNEQSEWLTEQAVAELLNLTAEGVRYMRRTGRGPVYHRFGRAVRYHRPDVDRWTEQNRVDPAA